MKRDDLEHETYQHEFRWQPDPGQQWGDDFKWSRNSFVERDFIKAFQDAKKQAAGFRVQKGIERVNLWGCSQTGEGIAVVLKAAGIELLNVYDSFRKGTFLNHPILHPSQGFDPDVPVIIASGQDRKALQPVIETLQRAGVRYFFSDGCEPETLAVTQFKNCHKGERCFVVGNGPSLNMIDMNFLRHEITFGSNRVYYGFDTWGYRFPYWAIVDTLVADDIQKEWNQFSDSIKFIPTDLRMHVQNFYNICFLDCQRDIASEYDGPSFDLRHDRFCVAGTVSYLLIQMAMYMGCNPIYLVGIDFNYVRPAHVTELEEPYKWLSGGRDPNHFFPEYFGKGRKWHDPKLENMGIVYANARRYADEHQFTILNATPDSKLDIFEKVDFTAIFR